MGGRAWCLRGVPRSASHRSPGGYARLGASGVPARGGRSVRVFVWRERCSTCLGGETVIPTSGRTLAITHAQCQAVAPRTRRRSGDRFPVVEQRHLLRHRLRGLGYGLLALDPLEDEGQVLGFALDG